MDQKSQPDRFIAVQPNVILRCSKCWTPIVTKAGVVVTFRGPRTQVRRHEGATALTNICPQCNHPYSVPDVSQVVQ